MQNAKTLRSPLDPRRRREARVLLHRLLEEAEMQRAAGTGTDAE